MPKAKERMKMENRGCDMRERVARRRRLRQRPPDGAEDTLTNGDGADIGHRVSPGWPAARQV
eukprot:scaffold1557_cov108-Isochrysis_galbana.AAC.13